MDPPSASPAHPSNQIIHVTSLPGRDHIADADSSHSRKRPRLSHELDSPPAINHHSSNPSDSQSISAESPIIIEVPQDQSTDPSEISIVMTGDERGKNRYVSSFPFQRFHLPDWSTPELAASRIVELCWKKDDPTLQLISELVVWLKEHLDETEADFSAAIRHEVTSAEVFELYSDHTSFWNNVVGCFAGLVGRTSFSASHELRGSGAYSFFEETLTTFVGLGERLLYTDLAILAQREARRDSTSSSSSPSSPKHPMQFLYWPEAFNLLAVSRKEFLEPMSSTYRFNTKAVQKAALSRFQGRAMNAVVQLLGHIVSKPENVQSPFSTAYHFVVLCREVLLVDVNNTGGWLNEFFQKSTQTFELVYIMATQILPKQHLDDQSQAVVEGFRLFLGDTLNALSLTKHLPPAEIYRLTLKDVAEYHTDQAELLIAPATHDASRIEGPEADDSLGTSLMREGIHQAGLRACNLEFFNALIRSSSVDLRNRGVDKLGSELISIHSGPEKLGTRLHELMKCFTTKFLSAKNITAYLYGPQSHATLIARTLPIVAIMADTSSLTKLDADIIWDVFTNSQQPDNAQSAGQVLLELGKHMPVFTQKYFCDKFRNMPLSQFTKDAGFILHSLLMAFLTKAPGSEFHAISTCISLLDKVEHSDLTPGKQNGLLMTLKKQLNAIRSPNSITEAIDLIELCANSIMSLPSRATGYALAMSCILRQTNFSVPPQEILSRLSFQQCAEELLHFLKRAKSETLVPAPQAFVCRLDLVFDLLSISSPYLDTVATEREIWDHVVGQNALNPGFREMGWNMLVARFQMNQPGLEAFYQRCINQYLPDLSPEFVTIGTARIFVFQSARQETDETALLPLEKELIRFALSVPMDEIANHFGSILFTGLFTGKALKYPGLAIKNQVSVVKECISRMVQQDEDAPRAPQMLLMILGHSIEFEKALEQSQKDVSATQNNAESETPKDRMEIPIRVHKGGAQPQSKTVTVNKKASCSELDAAIVSETGFESYTVISAGRRINFAEEPEQPVAHLGVQDGKVLVVQRRSTFQSIQADVDKTVGKSQIQREVLAHLDVLYSMLDEANDKAHVVLQILALLKFPGPIRAMISSTTTPFNQIFPSGISLRLRTSIEVLNLQLREQVSLGVADEKFLLRGVHLLVALLYRSDLLQDAGDISRTAETLLSLLRERPVNDVAEGYFEDATRFTDVIFSIITNLQSRNVASNIIPGAIRALYQCLVEGVLLDSSVRSAFCAAQRNREIHLKLLLTGNEHLRATIPNIIINAVQDEKTSPKVKVFFSRMFIDYIIPAAMEQPTFCDGAFMVSIEVISADQSLTRDEVVLKSLIGRFAANLLNLEHLEHYGNRFIDQRVSGLILLLRCCIQNIKSLGKSPSLGDLASQLFKKLLFPVVEIGEIAQPVIAPETRNNIYDLLRLLCDNVQTIEALTYDCGHLLKNAGDNDEFSFPGPERFVRQEGGYAGLENLAQTCYLNSLVQQLFMNLQFRKFIFDTPVPDAKKQVVLEEFKKAFASMQDSHNVSYRPEALVKALGVDHTVQDDAHIFFMTLIGQLEDSMPDDEAKSTLKKFFRGVNKSQTIGSCNHVSESTDEYFNLSLVVKDKASLEESLEEYTKGAALEGSDRFRCTTCGSDEGISVDAVQRTALDHVPDNLVLGLRRFRYETYDGGSKVNDRFDFPERIDMSKYKLNRLAGVEDQSEPDVFQLVGVVVHQGTLQFGHYWSYAAERGGIGSGPLPWYRLEDSTVTPSSIEDVLRETRGGFLPPSTTSMQSNRLPVLRSDNAYVLFYQRTSSVVESAECVAPGTSLPSHAIHAKARLPQDLGSAIAQENERSIFLLHLFSASHVDFVRDLPGRLEMTKEVDTYRQRGIAAKIMATLFQYYHHVITNSFSHESIDYTSLVLQKLACSDNEMAGWLLDQLIPPASTETTRRSLILHKKQIVRSATNRLILACLRFFRKQHPVYYGSDVQDLKSSKMEGYVYGMVNIRHSLLECRSVVWKEYFELLGQVAELGREETLAMLEQDLLVWCLETLYLNDDTVLRKKHPKIVHYFANSPRKVDFASIFGCVYSLLHRFVDLRGGDALITDRFGRWTESDTLLLTFEEHDLLGFRSETRTNWLVENIIQGLRRPQNIIWHEWIPIKLTVLLTNAARVPSHIYDDTTQTLLVTLQYANAWDQVADAATLCLLGRTMKSKTEEEVLIELERIVSSRNLHEQGLGAVPSVKFVLIEVYAVQPMMIIQHLAVLASRLLVTDEVDVEKMVRDWLRLHVLVRDVLPKPYRLGDVLLLNHKVRAIKSLLNLLGDVLEDAARNNQPFKAFDYARHAYFDCTGYLKQTAVALEAELETWLASEAPEAEGHTELESALQDLLDEVGTIETLVDRHEGCRTAIDEWKQYRERYPSNEVVEVEDDSDNEQAAASDGSLSDLNEEDFEDAT